MANRSGLCSLVLFHLLFHFKVFIKVGIYYLPISTVDLSIDIWNNAYTWCTMTGFHHMGFMFPASCGTSLKHLAQCLIQGKKRGKTSGCFLGVMVCHCWSTWDLLVLTLCCNERGIVRASSVPRSNKFPPCGRNMFYSLSLLCFLLESLQSHSASAAGEGRAPTSQGSGKHVDLHQRGRRLRGNKNEIFSWSLEMPNFKHAISFSRHKYFCSTICFLPGSMTKPNAFKECQFLEHVACPSLLWFLPEPE